MAHLRKALKSPAAAFRRLFTLPHNDAAHTDMKSTNHLMHQSKLLFVCHLHQKTHLRSPTPLDVRNCHPSYQQTATWSQGLVLVQHLHKGGYSSGHLDCMLMFARDWHVSGWLKSKRYNRRKYTGQTSDNMDKWKSRGGKSRRRERKKKEDQRRKSEKRKSQKKVDAGVRQGRSRKTWCFPNVLGFRRVEK